MSVGWGCEEISGTQEKLGMRKRRRGDSALGQELEGQFFADCGRVGCWRLGRGTTSKGQASAPGRRPKRQP